MRHKSRENDIRALQLAIEWNRRFRPILDANTEDSGTLARRLHATFRGYARADLIGSAEGQDVLFGMTLAAIRGDEYPVGFELIEDGDGSPGHDEERSPDEGE